MEAAIRCPRCGSDDVRRERWSRRWAAITMALAGFMLPVRSRRWYCFACRGHFTVQAATEAPPRKAQ
jgi:transposase-like protein